MKVLLVSAPLVGHVNPILVVARILKSAGHTTAIYTGTIFREKVEAAGAKFFALPADVDYTPASIAKILAPFPPGPQQMVHGVKALFIDPIPSQFRGLQAAIKSFAPDLIVYENGLYGTLPLLLGPSSARVPCVCLSVNPLCLQREDGAPLFLGLPLATSDSQRERYKAMAAESDARVMAPQLRYANEQLSAMGVGELPGSMFESQLLLADMILQPSAPSFEFPLRQTPKHLRFIGALMPEGIGGVPPEVRDAKEAGRKIVLVSQGTLANRDLGQLIGPTIEALRGREDIFVVATTGGAPLENIPVALPANAAAFSFLNFGELLPLVDVLVALGSYGTVTQALTFGVPMALAGAGEDKPEVIARVEWNGAGIGLGKVATVAGIREAVGEILTTPGYRARAKMLADEFAAHDAARKLPQLLEELMEAEYASVTQGSKLR